MRPFIKDKYLKAITERGGSVLEDFFNATDKIQIKCANNHVWSAAPYRFIKKNPPWCPYCARQISEVDFINELKRCSKCRKWKKFNEFVLDKRKKLGITSDCKKCRAKRSKVWRDNNPELVISYRMSSEEAKRWRSLNKNKCSKYGLKWRSNNRDKINAAARRRRENSKHCAILSNIRGRFNYALKSHKADKTYSITSLIGCSIAELKKHLEATFTEGMTWENYGRGMDKWHIDHIIPCNAFDLKKENDQKRCFHYSNLQALWAIDNLTKAKGVYKK